MSAEREAQTSFHCAREEEAIRLASLRDAEMPRSAKLSLTALCRYVYLRARCFSFFPIVVEFSAVHAHLDSCFLVFLFSGDRFFFFLLDCVREVY